MTPQEDWLLLASCADTEKERLAAQVEPLGHIASDTKAQANAGEGPGATNHPTGKVSMNENAVALRLARQSDLPFIMATERLPGFEKMVGRWSEPEHLAALARPNHAYLLGTNTAGECAAFAIIRDLDDAHGNLCLKRIAVMNPNRGFGSKFLSLVVDWAFSETAGYRLWLEVLVNNARARHVYSSHGFAEEGLLREAFKLPDDSRINLVLMSLTRPEWIGRRGKQA